MSKTPKFIRSFLIIAAVAAATYFINVEVQTRLGESALEETGLEMRSLEEAQALAAKENKLVLADMSAIWCPSCRKLDKEVFSDDGMKAAIGERFVFARIEYESDAGKDFMAEYAIRGFPTILALKPDGSLVSKLPLTFDPIAFAANLRAVRK